ncbi:response regulator [Rubritalea marina]|uniref:response regulator n=1 Tax=Rubritalea marina TaxID=361055 RepID=UPI00052501F0|nr:response regulator transcription factor [Rubritalea marina]
MSETIRIMMVEDHPEYREIVELAIGRQDDMELVSQFGTAERALRSLDDPGAEAPDVVLLDLHLPGMNGLEAISYFTKQESDLKIIVLTQSDQEADVLKAIMLGASGYLLKASTVKQLTEGIRMVMKGGASLDAKVAKFVMTTLKSKLPQQQMESMLTDREIQTLALLADGLVKKEIAERLNISVSTVVTHVCNIYAKLDVKNAPSAIAKAFKLGLLTLDDKG